MRDLRSDVIMAQTTSLRTVPGCSPRRIANAIASSSRPGLSRPARSATVQANRWMGNQQKSTETGNQLAGQPSTCAPTPAGPVMAEVIAVSRSSGQAVRLGCAPLKGCHARATGGFRSHQSTEAYTVMTSKMSRASYRILIPLLSRTNKTPL
jgi:hypothetical protein